MSKSNDSWRFTHILVKFVRAKVHNRFVVAARVEHEDMSAPDVDHRLGNARRPHLGILLQMLLNRLDRALDVVLEHGDAVRDRWLHQLLGQPRFQQSTYHIRLGVAMRGQMRDLEVNA